jgi:hypothetical protein
MPISVREWKRDVEARLARVGNHDLKPRWRDEVFRLTYLGPLMETPVEVHELLLELPYGGQLSRRLDEMLSGGAAERATAEQSRDALVARLNVLWEAGDPDNGPLDERPTCAVPLTVVQEWREAMFGHARFGAFAELLMAPLGHELGASVVGAAYVLFPWIVASGARHTTVGGVEVLDGWPQVAARWKVFAAAGRIRVE